jgi:hypothetical protein
MVVPGGKHGHAPEIRIISVKRSKRNARKGTIGRYFPGIPRALEAGAAEGTRFGRRRPADRRLRLGAMHAGISPLASFAKR